MDGWGIGQAAQPITNQPVTSILRLQFLSHFQQVHQHRPQFVGVKWLCQICVRAAPQPGDAVFYAGFGCEQHDGNMTGALVVFQPFAHLETVFFGHHHVRDDEVGDHFECPLDACLAVAGQRDLVLVAHTSGHIVGHVSVVFHDE